jgi:hypothetical protein
MNLKNDISVVVFANSKDFFLTKLCISSIRFYHPDVEILLVKDELNGKFNSRVLEKKFNVKNIKLNKRYFGWGSAKVHFPIDFHNSSKRYLILDSDIVFTGKLLNRLNNIDADFIVHPEIYDQPFSDMVKQIFLDPDTVKTIYPEYEYPGYFFNTGQMVITPSLFDAKLLEKCFDKNKYPYFTQGKILNLADQSLFNAVLPIMFKEEKIKHAGIEFMQWSGSFFDKEENNNIEAYLDGSLEFLVHYAGDTRVTDLSKMNGSNLLLFFKKEYESKLTPIQICLSNWQDKFNENKRITRLRYLKNAVLIKYFKVN